MEGTETHRQPSRKEKRKWDRTESSEAPWESRPGKRRRTSSGDGEASTPRVKKTVPKHEVEPVKEETTEAPKESNGNFLPVLLSFPQIKSNGTSFRLSYEGQGEKLELQKLHSLQVKLFLRGAYKWIVILVC